MRRPCYVPNGDHSLRGTDAYETLMAWHHATLNQVPLPQFTWQHGADGTLTVTTRTQPKQVLLWQAHNDAVRDFRLEIAGPIYHSVPMDRDASGNYVAKVPAPAKGWSAYFAELTFDLGAPVPLKLTTDVRVTPDTLPFPAPSTDKPRGFLSK